MSGQCQLVDSAKWSELLETLTTVIFDADGVLWLRKNAIPGSPELVAQLTAMGKRVIIVTNNSTKTSTDYEMKCQMLGYTSVTKDMIVSPPVLCVDALKRLMLGKSKIYLIGSTCLRNELTHNGFEFVGDGPDHFEHYTNTDYLYNLPLDPDVGAVVVSYDNHFSYIKLLKATHYLHDPTCLFIATNEDIDMPGTDDQFINIPATDALVAAVATSARRRPLVMGKPHSATFDYITANWNIDPSKTLMVGDRCHVDVKFGVDHGMKTMLVLSGVHNLSDVENYRKAGHKEMLPDYYVGKLGDLV